MTLQELYDKLHSVSADRPSMPVAIMLQEKDRETWWLPVSDTKLEDGKYIISSVSNLERVGTTVENLEASIGKDIWDNKDAEVWLRLDFAQYKGPIRGPNYPIVIGEDSDPIISGNMFVPVVSCGISDDLLKFRIRGKL